MIKATYKTNFSMVLLAYLQKAIAIIVALFFGIMYLKPAISKATGFNNLQAIASIAIALIIFELILHFALEAFTKALVSRVVEITHLIGAILTFAIIAVLGWYATDNLPYFRSDINQKTKLINTDSLRRVHSQIISQKQRQYDKKLADLDSIYLPQITTQKGWILNQTQSTYNQSRSLLLAEKNNEMQATEQRFATTIKQAEWSNKQKTDKVEEQDKADAQSTAWLSIIILIFSIYSTVVIGIYKSQTSPTNLHTSIQTDNYNDTAIQNTTTIAENTTTNLQPVLPQTILQNTVQNYNSITLLVSGEKKSQKRILAEAYITAEKLFEKIEQKELTDKQVFLILKEKFEISWGTYSNIKKEWKQINK